MFYQAPRKSITCYLIRQDVKPSSSPLNSVPKYGLVIVTCLVNRNVRGCICFITMKQSFTEMTLKSYSQMGHGEFLARSTFMLDVLSNKTEHFKIGKSLQYA